MQRTPYADRERSPYLALLEDVVRARARRRRRRLALAALLSVLVAAGAVLLA